MGFFQYIFIFISLIYIPIKISFDLQITNYILLIFLEIMPFLFYCADILITLNTEFYSKGGLISDKLQIFGNYRKKEFLLDIISLLLPAILSLIFPKKKIILGFFLFRIIKFKSLVKKTELLLQPSNKTHYLFVLIKLLFLILYIAHICGCVWSYISVTLIKAGYSEVWLQIHNLVDEDWFIKLILKKIKI